jgi:maltose alpha-D-glucosyltransferase / alpha-amylase
MPLPMTAPNPQPPWYKDAVIYQFGRSLFPRIGELPYMLTLGPYSFFWFKLRRF